jgi:hypothetical protein
MASIRVLPTVSALIVLLAAAQVGAQDDVGPVRLDRTRPVPAKSEVLAAWRKRQDAIHTFRFEWTERQTHARGWLPNPRYPEREWLSIANLLRDRTYVVSKTLAVDGDRMRYAFDIDRPAEADGVRVTDSTGRNDGLGVHRHYGYLSVWDGRTSSVRLTSSLGEPPPTTLSTTANVDAQNLDMRPILLALRPLDRVMGHRLIDRAVCNQMRTFYRGSSTFKLEERHDPSGWKTMLWIEPERDFLVRRIDVLGEQKLIAAIDIDYVHDARWGWIPSAWRVSEMLADGSRRLASEATVTRYAINDPIDAAAFR